MIHGGAQERNMRGGTENVYGIVGLAKALEIAYSEINEHQKYIQELKSYMIEQLRESIPGVAFNGDIDPNKSLYTVLNVSFPESEMGEMLLFSLDIAGISASGGSACSSGSNVGSHVLTAIGSPSSRAAVRFSFCKYNCVFLAIRAEKSVGKAIASSKALVCKDCVCPKTAAIASIVVRATLLNGSCSVKLQPDV